MVATEHRLLGLVAQSQRGTGRADKAKRPRDRHHAQTDA